MADLEPSDIPSYLRALRKRAGLSTEQMAQAMGYRGGSSYQRFERLGPRRGYMPYGPVLILAARIAGRGTPPIDPAEVMALAGKMSQAGAANEPSESAYQFSAEKVLQQFAAAGRISPDDIPAMARMFARAIPLLLKVVDPILKSGTGATDPQLNEISAGIAEIAIRQSGQDT